MISRHLETVLILLGAGGLALLLLLLLTWLLARRSATRAARADVTDVVAELTTRVDELASDLLRALERAEEEAQRGRFLGELSGTIDLDEVLSRLLDAASDVDGVDAAVVTIEPADESEPIVAALGMPLEEARGQTFSAPPGAGAQTMAVTYRYPEGAEEGQVRAALALPLHDEPVLLGFLAAYTRSRAEIGSSELEDLARRAGPAIANALRFREARRLADLDALTGLHNRRYFHETLSREVARAQRYGRRLALVIVDLDDFKAVNEQIGHLAGDGVLAEAAERIRGVVRTSDIACRVGGDEFAVILPESGIGQADQLYRRIQAVVSGRAIGHIARLDVSAGVAELSEGDDGTTLFERADEALYRAKDAGKSRAFPALTVQRADEPEANSNSA